MRAFFPPGTLLRVRIPKPFKGTPDISLWDRPDRVLGLGTSVPGTGLWTVLDWHGRRRGKELERVWHLLVRASDGTRGWHGDCDRDFEPV